jgi:single-strand DNA-binding protein
MSGTVNKVILIGRLGRDPEMKFTASGVPMARFSLATDESFKDRSGEQQKRTEWHNIVAWNKLAEICSQYLTKGKQIYIEGRISSRQWQDQSGNKRTTYEIIAQRMQMLGSRADSELPAQAGRAAGATAGASPEAAAVEDAERSRSAEPPMPTEPPTPSEGSDRSEITDEDVPF